jgi:hypothetical protein
VGVDFVDFTPSPRWTRHSQLMADTSSSDTTAPGTDDVLRERDGPTNTNNTSIIFFDDCTTTDDALSNIPYTPDDDIARSANGGDAAVRMRPIDTADAAGNHTREGTDTGDPSAVNLSHRDRESDTARSWWWAPWRRGERHLATTTYDRLVFPGPTIYPFPTPRTAWQQISNV